MSVVRSGYTRLQRWSHWAIVVLCVAAYPTAQAIRNSHLGHVFGLKGSFADQIMARVHEWGGWLALAFAGVLIVGRLRHRTPPLPPGMAKWQRWLAHGTHFAIYAGILALVSSGALAMYIGGGYGQMHVTLANVGIGLIGVHVLAALWHQVVMRDQLLARMWPTSRTNNRGPT